MTGSVWALVPAGGSGSRFSTQTDKLQAMIDGKPVLLRTVEALLGCEEIEGCLIVASQSNLPVYQQILHPLQNSGKPLHFCLGGQTRRESVYHGLLSLADSACEYVVVHDAARPFFPIDALKKAIALVKCQTPAAILAVPCVDTIKQAIQNTHTVATTIARDTLWRVQTPQVFMREALLKAHNQIPREMPVTDDAQLLELAGLGPVKLIEGSETNIKITHPIDLQWAEFLKKTGSV